MNSRGPVVIIEDDFDDQQLLSEVFAKLNYTNEVVFFDDGYKALDYVNKSEVRPFLILSDVNMPRIDGLELRNKVHNNAELNVKCIPYLFFTTTAQQDFVTKAYSLSVQGFFKKPTNYSDLERTIKLIMDYWKECISPSNFKPKE